LFCRQHPSSFIIAMGSYSAFQTITACLDEKLATGRAKHDDSSFRAHSLKASWALVLSRFSENQTPSFAVLETPKAPVDSRCLESACIISPHVETWQISGNPDTLLVDAAKLQQRKPWLETGGNRRSDATTAVVIRSHGGLGDTHSAVGSLAPMSAFGNILTIPSCLHCMPVSWSSLWIAVHRVHKCPWTT
jgi:hypothetical protein